MIRRPPRSTQSRSSAASDVYKRQGVHGERPETAMFSVIRKLQGRPEPEHKSSKSYEAHNKHIAKFACNDNVAEPDPSVVTLGFNRNTFPKLRRLLDHPETDVDLASGTTAFESYIPKDSEKHAVYIEGCQDRADLINAMRQKALYALIEQLHDPVNVSLAVSNGLVASLNERCLDENPCIREYSVIALGVVSEQFLGLQELYTRGSIGVLCRMMDDSDHVTRCNVFLTLLKVCHTAAGVESVLAEPESYEHIVEKCRWDDVEVKNLALELLYAMLKICPDMSTERIRLGIKALGSLLEESEAPLRQWACNNLTVLTISTEGKEIAICENVVPLVIRLIADEESTVRAAAMGTLMNVTVSKQGKRLVLTNDGITGVIAMLNHSVNEVSLLNVVKTIANVAECPQARAELQPCVQRLRDLEENSDNNCLLYTSPSPRDRTRSRMPSSA
eukprot:TRINITY_DN3198_c0_g1_i1.p1 TRINITY_DN3198_c0_g1~~TRINITY_DN3198_c0_g1_i1.p1  ORF type:complete len:447 (+),score=169.24 TRINITY_DN3198_c0_g1_i1:67-1407(+)